jgi:pyrroline-5-carboxylate reductase
MIAFIGGGNMAQAMLGGMRAAGLDTGTMHVLEPDAARRDALKREFGIVAHPQSDAWLNDAELVVLAVKPQQAQQAVSAAVLHLRQPIVLSIVAGVQGQTLARWLGHERIVRAMPNTPALIGAGITGAVALAQVSAADRAEADRVLRSIGKVVWLDKETLLDPVTAISGSGPAYVFYFIEALQEAAREMGFNDEQARTLAVETFLGAARLAEQSNDAIAVLRERVTSKGGTTAAALASMARDDVRARIVTAARAARDRAEEMGRELDAASDDSRRQ